MQSIYTEFENAVDEIFNKEAKTQITEVIGILRGMGYKLNREERRHILDRQFGPRIVQKVFREFLRSGTTQRFVPGVLYYLAALSRLYFITDSELASNILKEAYYASEDGPLYDIFSHAFYSDFIYPMGMIPESSDQTGNSTMNFFLHHAKEARLQFNGVRFQDLPFLSPFMPLPPVFHAAINIRPPVLMLLLRYGAKVEANVMPDVCNLRNLFRYFIQSLWKSLGEDLQSIDHETVECVKILLRDIPQIRMGEINFLLTKSEGGVVSGSVCSHDFIRQLSENDVVPEFVNRCLEPSRLTHLCRCVIRNSLNNSWHLPYGIDLLPLPIVMKSYLSLEID